MAAVEVEEAVDAMAVEVEEMVAEEVRRRVASEPR